jgi:hypothetical protein
VEREFQVAKSPVKKRWSQSVVRALVERPPTLAAWAWWGAPACGRSTLKATRIGTWLGRHSVGVGHVISQVYVCIGS